MPCSNNATCLDLINTYECRCPSGFTGDHCEININECDSSPCAFGSECIDLVDGYYCQCKPGYTGLTCSTEIDECSSDPCMNRGKCVDLINRFECDCASTGFQGHLCETNINDCENVTCEHNGTCIDGINAYKCECFAGYEGRLCEKDVNECASSPCVYGKCWENSDEQSFMRRQRMQVTNITLTTMSPFDYSKAAGYWCECIPGYTGANCETKINECNSNPCGTNGECIDLVNEYKCKCFPGFTGKQCTENINECEMYAPCAYRTKCIDLVPNYANFNRTQLNETSTQLDPNLLGYYCDCTQLNENLIRQNGNAHVLYTGQNCSVKLNACQTSKNLCKHDSECRSVLNEKQEQDVECVCQPGYTGPYCEETTTFRMDGSYALTHTANTFIYQISFDFKVNFYDRFNLPLLHIRNHDNSLLIDIQLNRNFLAVNDKQIPFYSEDTRVWHSLSVQFFNDSTIQLNYAVKEIYLSLTSLIRLNSSTQQTPFSFSLGKYFSLSLQPLTNEPVYSLLYSDELNYLTGACVRDFRLNNMFLFTSKVNKQSAMTNETSSQIKFGCEAIKNVCQSVDEPVCMNNSTCLFKQFSYECVHCERPFYGKNCQFESNKLVFLPELVQTQENQTMTLKSDPQQAVYLSLKLIDSAKPSTREGFVNKKDSSSFEMSFELSRLLKLSAKKLKRRSIKNQLPGMDDSFIFLILKEEKSTHELVNSYYVFSIDKKGSLLMSKMQSKLDLNELNKLSEKSHDEDDIKLHWSIRNDQLDLNQFHSFRLYFKLSLNFVELSLNHKFKSRFQLLNAKTNQAEQFVIEKLKFSNYATNDYLFIINELKINDKFYEFNEGKMFMFDEEQHQINEALINYNSILSFNATIHENLLLSELNKFYCANNLR
jgi:hypothetical protein